MFDYVFDLFEVLICLLLQHEDLRSMGVAVARDWGESSEDGLDFFVFGGNFDDGLVLKAHVFSNIRLEQKGHVNNSILSSNTSL